MTSWLLLGPHRSRSDQPFDGTFPGHGTKHRKRRAHFHGPTIGGRNPNTRKTCAGDSVPFLRAVRNDHDWAADNAAASNAGDETLTCASVTEPAPSSVASTSTVPPPT